MTRTRTTLATCRKTRDNQTPHSRAFARYSKLFAASTTYPVKAAMNDWSTLPPDDQLFTLARLAFAQLSATLEQTRLLQRLCRSLEEIQEAVEDGLDELSGDEADDLDGAEGEGAVDGDENREVDLEEEMIEEAERDTGEEDSIDQLDEENEIDGASGRREGSRSGRQSVATDRRSSLDRKGREGDESGHEISRHAQSHAAGTHHGKEQA